ncbi:MAG TPA: hypothetical protein VGM17_01895 [Rhizomicrobium sp.]
MPLADRTVLSTSGPETKTFLQGLVTNDVTKLSAEHPLYAALLTPQGKVLFDFILSERDGEVLIDCAAASAEILLKRLTMYRLRAKVELKPRDDLAAFWSTDEFPGALPDPRLPELGWRDIAARGDSSDGAAAYAAHRLSLGVPEGGDFGSDKVFALDAGLEELHGVSFDKGCYVGQELTARMKHRGTARKRLLPIASSDGRTLPAAGSEVRAGETSLGEISSTYGPQGFALIRLDRWHEVGPVQPHAGDLTIAISKPAWLGPVESP